MFMKVSDELQLDAMNKTDIPVAAVVVITPAVQHPSSICKYSTQKGVMNKNVV
jgi:hypothetical protein